MSHGEIEAAIRRGVAMAAVTKNARDLFLEALERIPAERTAYVDEACGGDAALCSGSRRYSAPTTSRGRSSARQSRYRRPTMRPPSQPANQRPPGATDHRPKPWAPLS